MRIECKPYTSLIADCSTLTDSYITCFAAELGCLEPSHAPTQLLVLILPTSPWLDFLLSLAFPISTQVHAHGAGNIDGHVTNRLFQNHNILPKYPKSI